VEQSKGLFDAAQMQVRVLDAHYNGHARRFCRVQKREAMTENKSNFGG
jgi:hypothetical protein